MAFNPHLAYLLLEQADQPEIPTYVADLLTEAAKEIDNTRPVWLDPYKYPPPGGDVLMLTWGGICIRAKFSHDQGRAWLPLPDTPAELKRRRRA